MGGISTQRRRLESELMVETVELRQEVRMGQLAQSARDKRQPVERLRRHRPEWAARRGLSATAMGRVLRKAQLHCSQWIGH